MPVLSNFATRSAGLSGCNDQLHTANRSLRELLFMFMLSQPSPVPDHASRITHHASRITHHASRITHHASRITHHASRITPHASRITP
jgi:hypothetical protein